MASQPAADLEALCDLRTPWCLHLVATLRIAHQLAAGKEQIDEIAIAAGCDAYALHRVLTHLVSKGVFEEPAPGHFRLNEAAEGLLDPIAMLSLDLERIGGRMAHAWGTLLSYVCSGEPAYQQVFGRPFWEDLNAYPEVADSFDALIGPAGHGTFEPNFEIADGWDSVQSLVDVGGGTGAMLAALLRLRPRLRGTLVDLPRTVARASEIFQSAGVADRVTLVGQSFFDPLPAGADVYLLRGILNDWPDEEAVAILRRCAEAARPGGRLVVLKSVGPEGASQPIEIEMVLCGGKKRTVSEFSELAHQAGLNVVAAGKQASGYFVVECRPS